MFPLEKNPHMKYVSQMQVIYSYKISWPNFLNPANVEK